MSARRLILAGLCVLNSVFVFAQDRGSLYRDPESAYSSGQARLRSGDLTGAQTALEQAVAAAPNNAKYLSALGMVYLRAGQGESAAKTYSHMCALIESEYGEASPRLWPCHTLWANALMMARDVPGATEKFRSAATMAMNQRPQPTVDCLMTLYSLAAALNATGRMSEAVPLYEQLLADTPSSSPYRPEVEDAVRRIRAGRMPARVM